MVGVCANLKTDTALLVIDVQVGMFSETDPVYAGDLLLERIRGLISKARSSGIEVVYVQHNEEVGQPLETNTNAWNIHPDITPVDGDIVIQKHTPDSFHETNLQHELTIRGVKKLVLTGIQTDMCVEATGRRAHSLGYDVTIAQDAHSTFGYGDLTALEIINQYNDEVYPSFAEVRASQAIAF